MSVIPKIVEQTLLSVLVALFVTLLWQYFRRIARFVYLASKIPGPSIWTLITSHAEGLMSDNHLKILCDLSTAHGHKPWGLWTLGDYMIFVNDSASVSEVFRNKKLSNKANRFYDVMSLYVGKGLVTLDGPEYKRHRRAVRPAFRKNYVDSRYARAYQQATALIERLRSIANGEEVDIRSTIDDFAYAVSLSTFSTDDLSYINRNEILEATNAANDLIKLGTKNTFYFKLARKFKTSIRQTESTIRARKGYYKNFLLVQKRLARVRMTEDEHKQPTSIPECIVSKSLETTDKELTEEEYFEESVVLVTTGAETTGFALNVTLLLLALHEEIQQHVCEEMESIFGQSERPVELEDLSKMVFTEMVIKESFRLFPPGPMLLRKVRRETKIREIVLPRGSVVAINIMALHRDPNAFKNPLKFDPNRFVPEESAKRHPFAYIPFSQGFRDCPGQHQAFTVLKATLCLILRDFKVLPGAGLKSVETIKFTVSTTTRLCESSLRLVSRKKNV